MIHVVPFKPAHYRLIAQDMRNRDREELLAGWRQTPWEVMSHGLSESTRALTVLHGTRPMCAAGVMPLEILTSRYALWIIGTREIDRFPLAFARASRRWLPRLIAGCGTVTNLVDKEDTRALKWARWLGFDFKAYVQDGIIDERFLQFFAHGGSAQCQRVA